MKFLDYSYSNNTVREWMIAVGIVLGILIILKAVKKFTYRKLDIFTASTESEWDDLIPHLIQRSRTFFFFLIGLYFASITLVLPDTIHSLIKKVFMVGLFLQLAIWGTHTISFWLTIYKKQQITRNAGAVTTFSAVAFILQLLLWSILLLLTLSNLGVNVTALVTSLGVGGIAIALAVQNILGDLFASFSIILDKPFVIGDFIIVNEYLGAVEKIGIKTTRIRSLSGEQLIFSNTDLLKSRIRNYKRMAERRVVFTLGVVYQTTHEQLVKIPVIIREIIEAQQQVRFDRAHFRDYGAYALNFEVVYWVHSPDYNIYMDIQQAINLSIYDRFKTENIQFAYPTQTFFLNDTSKTPLNPDMIDHRVNV